MALSLALRRTLFSAALAAPVLVVACGSRGPLDVEVVEVGPDASVKLDAIADVPGETSSDAVHDAVTDVVDAAPEAMSGFDGGPLLNCGSCVIQNCGSQLFTCVSSPGCGAALQCLFTMCLAGGNVQNLPQCLGGCAGGNAMTEQQLLTVLGCILGSCSTQCMGLAGGIGGGGSSGGGGGGGSGGGAGG